MPRKIVLQAHKWNREGEVRFEICGNGHYIHIDDVAEFLTVNATMLAAGLRDAMQTDRELEVL